MGTESNQGETQTETSLDSVVDQREAGDQDVNKGIDSSADATAKPDKVEKSLEETLQERIDQEGKSTSSEEEAEDGGVSNPNETAEEKAARETKEKESVVSDQENADLDTTVVEKKPVPYTRFEEVVRDRDDKQNEIARLTPLAQRQEAVQQYCQQNNVSDNEVVEALELAALLKTNPGEFAKRIQPVLEGIGVMTGDKLPDDLRARAERIDENVSTGALSKEDADLLKEGLRETAKLRAQLKFGSEKEKFSTQQNAQRQQQEFVQSIQSAWTGWSASIAKKDPSFKPKVNGSPDGMFEFVNDKITAMASQTDAKGQPVYPIRNPAEAVKLAEAAYKAVSESFKGLRSKPTARRPALNSNGSQITSAGERSPLKAKTLDEALAMGLEDLQSGKRNW